MGKTLVLSDLTIKENGNYKTISATGCDVVTLGLFGVEIIQKHDLKQEGVKTFELNLNGVRIGYLVVGL